jgi:hypothetical protein
MKFKHLLAVVATCIGISGHGIANASHIPATVYSAANLSYFSGTTLTRQAFSVGTQCAALCTENCPRIGCSGFFFAAYKDPDDSWGPDFGSEVTLDLGALFTIDNTYEIEVTDIDGISLPGKLGAISVSADNSSFTPAGNIFGEDDGILSLASLIGTEFQYIKIQQLNNSTGCGGGNHVCQALALDSVIVNHASVVPVPASVWLFGSGLLGLIGIARRRNS